MKISSKPVSAWMWRAPAPGEVVPDLPPVDVTQQIKSVEIELEFPPEVDE